MKRHVWQVCLFPTRSSVTPIQVSSKRCNTNELLGDNGNLRQNHPKFASAVYSVCTMNVMGKRGVFADKIWDSVVKAGR